MSVRSSTSAPGSLDLRSYSQVLHWATEKTRSSSNTRQAFLTVYRWNTQIEKTGTFNLTLSGMKSVLDSLVLRFDDMPHGLRYVITSWTVSDTFPIVTTTTINGLLTFRFIPIKGEKLKLQTAIRPSKRPLQIFQSIGGSERRAKGKSMMSAVGATGNKSVPRLNPETRQVKSTLTNSNLAGVTTSSTMFEVYRRTYLSVNTPEFIKKRREGKLPVNNYSMSSVEIMPGPYYVSQINTNGSYFIESYDVMRLLQQSDIPSGHLGVDENLLIATLRGRISATANIGEDIATASQTLGMVTSSLSRFSIFVQLVNGGTPRQLSRFLGRTKSSDAFVTAVRRMRRGGLNGVKLFSQLWLEYRYGLLPLIGDVQAAMLAWKQYVSRNPENVCRVSASRTMKSVNKRSVVYASNPGSSSVRTRYFYENVKTTCRMGLYYRMGSNMLTALSGLGLTNPVALAWDLMPFSFLVDWVLPIGPALQAFSAFEGLTFVRGYKTYYTESTVLLKVNQNYSYSEAVYSDSGSSFGRRITLNRTALTGFPGSSVPLFKNPWSLIHAANAAALIGVVLTKGYST